MDKTGSGREHKNKINLRQLHHHRIKPILHTKVGMPKCRRARDVSATQGGINVGSTGMLCASRVFALRD